MGYKYVPYFTLAPPKKSFVSFYSSPNIICMNQTIKWAGQEQIVDMHTVLVRKPEEMQTLQIPKLYGEDNIKMGLNSVRM